MNKKFWVGVDVGGTKTAVVLSPKLPGVLGRVEFPTRPARGPQQALTLIKKAVVNLLANTVVHCRRWGGREAKTAAARL